MSDAPYGGTAGSASTYDDPSAGNTMGSYGNTHSSTSRVNPIHPSSAQSTANPAYGRAHTHSSPYETAGANPGQGGSSAADSGTLGSNYHDALDATYGHATGPATGPSDTTSGRGATGPYETAGANPGQAVSSSQTSGGKSTQGGGGLKGVVAAVHGAGESIRGQLNAGVDKAFNEPTGEAKNAAIANSGEQEMATGDFSTQTKNREGAIPGDHEKRANQPL